MEKNERHVIELDWNLNGKFEALIVNGEMKHFMGTAPSGGVDIYSNDYRFLLALRDNINEMETEVKSQMARLGKNGGNKNNLNGTTEIRSADRAKVDAGVA